MSDRWQRRRDYALHWQRFEFSIIDDSPLSLWQNNRNTDTVPVNRIETGTMQQLQTQSCIGCSFRMWLLFVTVCFFVTLTQWHMEIVGRKEAWGVDFRQDIIPCAERGHQVQRSANTTVPPAEPIPRTNPSIPVALIYKPLTSAPFPLHVCCWLSTYAWSAWSGW